MMLNSLPNPDALKKSSARSSESRDKPHSPLTTLGSAEAIGSDDKENEENVVDEENDNDVETMEQHDNASSGLGVLSNKVLDPFNIWATHEEGSDDKSERKKRKHKKKKRKGSKKEKKKKRKDTMSHSSGDDAVQSGTEPSHLSGEFTGSERSNTATETTPKEEGTPSAKDSDMLGHEKDDLYNPEEYEPDYEEPVDDGDMELEIPTDQYPYNFPQQPQPSQQQPSQQQQQQRQQHDNFPERPQQSHPPPHMNTDTADGDGPMTATTLMDNDAIKTISKHIKDAVSKEMNMIQEDMREQKQAIQYIKTHVTQDISDTIRSTLETERQRTSTMLSSFESNMTHNLKQSVRDSLDSERDKLLTFTSNLESKIVREIQRAITEQENQSKTHHEEFFSSERSRLETLYSNMEMAIKSLQAGETDYKSKMNELFEEMKRFDEEREKFYEEQDQHAKQVREDQRELHRQRSELQAKKDSFAKEQSSKQQTLQNKEASIDQLQAKIDQDYGVIKEKREMLERRENELERARKNLQEEQESFRTMSQELTQTALKVQRESEMASEAFQKAAKERAEAQRLKDEAEQMKKDAEYEKNSILNETKKLQAQRGSFEKERLELAQERKQLALERSYHNKAAEQIRGMEQKLNQQAQSLKGHDNLLETDAHARIDGSKDNNVDNTHRTTSNNHDQMYSEFARELAKWEQERRLDAHAAHEQSRFLQHLGEDMMYELKGYSNNNNTNARGGIPFAGSAWPSTERGEQVMPIVSHNQDDMFEERRSKSPPRTTSMMAYPAPTRPAYRSSTTTATTGPIPSSLDHPSAITSSRTHNNTFSFTSLYPLSSMTSNHENTRGSSVPTHTGRYNIVNNTNNNHNNTSNNNNNNNNNNTNTNSNNNNYPQSNTVTPASADTYHTSPTSTVSSSENHNDSDGDSNAESGSRASSSTRSNEIESESTN